MPQPIQFLWDLLREDTPLWLFALAAILYFSIGPVREIARDRRTNRDHTIALENERKEQIIALIESCWVIRSQIDDRLGWVENEYITNPEMFPDPYSHIEGHETYRAEINRISQSLEAIHVHDGSHENLLETKLLLNEMKQVQRNVSSEETHIQRILSLHGSV